jgi:hypothetical protein
MHGELPLLPTFLGSADVSSHNHREYCAILALAQVSVFGIGFLLTWADYRV